MNTSIILEFNYSSVKCSLHMHNPTLLDNEQHLVINREKSTLCILSWSLTFFFSTNMAISEIKRSRVEIYPYPVKVVQQSSDTLTSTLAAFLFSSHPKREKDREAHLNYYTSACYRGRIISQHKIKLNQILQNKHAVLTKQCMQHKINTKSQV